MTLRVTPDELRTAARQIGSGSTGTTPHAGTYSPHTTTSSLRLGRAGIAATDSASALIEAAEAAETAIEVVHSRIGEWTSILTESAGKYEAAEETSARRLDALGDFNSRRKG